MDWGIEMTKKIFLPNGIADTGKDYLSSKGYDLVFGTSRDEDKMIEEGKDADAILVGTQKFSDKVISAMSNLKIIARNGVGYDSVDVASATEHKIYVTITPQALSESVAETTVTVLLDLAKNIYNDSYNMRKGNWTYKKAHQGHDLSNKTVGILGFGRIGQKVARLLKAFGMNILIFDPATKSSELGEVVSRDELFAQSDFITIHLPLIEATKNSIGTKEFDAMKSSAFLINLARGPIVNHDDLVTALGNNKIAGAALDVFDQEPLPESDALFDLDNVLLTPHIASNTVETRNQMALDAASEIDLVLSGKNPKWAVNKF